MNVLKALKVAAITVVMATSIHGYAQGIPTMDGIGTAQRLIEIQNMIVQLNQMKNQVSAITGNSNMGMILNNPALHNYLPNQWESIYGNVNSGSLGGISSSTAQILQQEGMANAPNAGQQRVNNTLAANKAMSMAAYDSSIQRLQNIQSLMQQSNATQSAAQKADLNNRINAEQAMIQNEQTRLNLMTTLQNSETAIAEHQQLTTYKNGLLGINASGNYVGNTGTSILGQ
jgi:type IV secretion system protein VirB5